MKATKLAATLLAIFAPFLAHPSSSFAYPVDPAKVPVAIRQDPTADHDFILAYDSNDKTIVYYAPKGGRVALMNGMPLLSFAVLPTGEGYLNAQLEFGVFGHEKEQLFESITRAGYRPVPFPYVRTTVRPITPNNDPVTGKQICTRVTDPATGIMTQDCDPTFYSALSYSKNGPSLGENIAISAILTKVGAATYSVMLRGGDSLQLNLDADYYKAGTAFTATVTVDYTKLYEQFHAYASASGFFSSAELEAAWKKSGLCVDMPASACAVKITYTDERGNVITNVAVDPNNREAQEKIMQAIDRLRDQLEAEMLTPVATELGGLDTSKPSFGYKLSAQYEHNVVQKHATFEFKSPIGVNVGHTSIPSGIACVAISPEGDVSRNAGGDCGKYWAGSFGFADVLAHSRH